MTEATAFKVGDRVRHDRRPEWGIGHVQRVKDTSIGNRPAQRLSIRFANAGLKTLSTLGAALTVVDDASTSDPEGSSGTMLDKEAKGESGWLGEISKRQPEDAMIQLPEEATDPFVPIEKRLRATLALYRFDAGGAALVDWAVARSGLDDPLSRFTRHELEQYFERWSLLREQHLRRLLTDLRSDSSAVVSALENAPEAGRRAAARVRGKG